MEGINYHICIVARIAVQTDCQVLLLSIYVHLDISQASRKPSSHFWPFLKGITVSNIKEIVFEQKGMLVASLRCQDRSEQNLRQDWVRLITQRLAWRRTHLHQLTHSITCTSLSTPLMANGKRTFNPLHIDKRIMRNLTRWEPYGGHTYFKMT